MSLTVVFRETALRSLARIRGDDKELFTSARDAITSLAGEPCPQARSRGAPPVSTVFTPKTVAPAAPTRT
jgi:hypothetical protein